MKISVSTDHNVIKLALDAVFGTFGESYQSCWLIDVALLADDALVAEAYAYEGPILLCDMTGIDSTEPRYSRGLLRLINRPSVAIVSFMPPELTEILSLLDSLSAGNTVPLRLDKVKLTERWLSFIRHDMGRDKGTETVAKAMANARELFNVKGTTAAEVLEELKAFDQKAIEISGPVIPGVFCDVEGTLLRGESLAADIVARLRDFEASGEQVTIWTGGDLAALTLVLRSFGVSWPIVAKANYRGRKVACAIDDLTEEELLSQYGIAAAVFDCVA